MTGKIHRNLLKTSPAVVATVHTRAGIDAATGLKRGNVDLLELRLDALLSHRELLLRALPGLRLPLLLTVRGQSEGGCSKLTSSERIALYREFSEQAQIVDLELRALKQPGFKQLAQEILDRKQLLLCSFHDFNKTPSVKRLHDLASEALRAGADVFKVATVAETPSELGRLLAFLSEEKRLPLAVMAMGKMGKISRLLFAQCGSVLNYGFLDKPQVSGQWPAALLKQRLKEL